MDKKQLITIASILVVVVGGLGYAYYVKSDADEENEVSTSTTEIEPGDQGEDTESAVDKTPGRYIDFSDDALASTPGTKLLFFHAPWCPQCRSIETSIEENGLPENVTVLKVDYDSNQNLRQKYGVTLQTTFVKVDDAGNELDSYVAYEEPTFVSVERELLR